MADTFSDKGKEIKNAILKSKEDKEAILNNLFGEVMAEEPKKRKVKGKKPLKEQFPEDYDKYLRDPTSDEMSFAEYLGL